MLSSICASRRCTIAPELSQNERACELHKGANLCGNIPTARDDGIHRLGATRPISQNNFQVAILNERMRRDIIHLHDPCTSDRGDREPNALPQHDAYRYCHDLVLVALREGPLRKRVFVATAGNDCTMAPQFLRMLRSAVLVYV